MRTSVPAAIAALVLALPVVLIEESPSLAAATVFVETNPSTVPAGDQIGIRASCDDNLKPATVTIDPIGAITVSPSYGFLTSTTRVPPATDAGDYPVRLKCPDGKTAENTLHVVVKVEPARGPATGGGGTAPRLSAGAMIGGGLATVVAGVVLGVVAVRRRRLG